MPSILTKLLHNISENNDKKISTKSKLLDFEKMIADQARANGLQPRTYLEQLCKQSESFASSKLVKVLLGEKIDEGRVKDMMLDMEADAADMSKEEFIKAHGEKYAYIWDRVQAQERGDTNEMDVPTQKGRDAKRDVLTPKSMNKVKQGIKQAAKKQRRRMDKDAVDEQGFVKGMKMPRPGDNISTQDKMKMLQAIKQKRIQHAKMAPGLAKDKLSGEILDMMANAKVLLQSVYEDAEQDTQYAKMIIQQNPQEYKKFMQTGDLMDAPTVYEKLFAYFSSSDADDQMPYGTQKARDGDPYVWITDKLDDLGLTEGNEFAQKVRQLKAQGAKKGTKFKTSDGKEHTLEDLVEKMMLVRDQVAKAVADKVQDWAKGASIDQINKVLAMIKSGAKLKPEGPQSASIEESNYQRGGVRVNPQQAKQAKVTGTVTRVSGDMVTIRNDRTNKTYDVDTIKTNIVPQVDMRGEPIDGAPLVIQHQGSSYNINPSKIGQRSAMSGGVQVGDKIKLESIVESKAITEEQFEQLAEKKDACYHKVKSRYKVWPSAYASGALVQCRKVGAKNWGNKSKK